MRFKKIKEALISLLEDANVAENFLETNPSSQFARRTYVRSIFAAIEGTIWILKDVCFNVKPRTGKRIMTVHYYLPDLFSGHIIAIYRLHCSSFYEWHNKSTHQIKVKSIIMEQKVIAVFKEHKRRYGVRRIVAELSHQNVQVSPYKVRKYLAGNGLKAIQPRSFVPKTTDNRHPYAISPNHLKDLTFPEAINQVWVGDITYIPMVAGNFRYLSVWMDICSRKIVGWLAPCCTKPKGSL